MPMSWSVLVVPPLVLTGVAALFLLLYLASKRSICRQIAMVLLLIATILWITPVLIALGVIPRPLIKS